MCPRAVHLVVLRAAVRLTAVPALILFSIPALAADWIRIAAAPSAAGNIEILTDAGPKTGRQILTRFEDIRRIFREANTADSPLELRVFVFASEKEFRAYRDGAGTEGFYQSAAERDYIALPATADAGRIATHEYVHLVLNHSAVPLPKWFEEGTGELYSTLVLDGDRLRIGEPIGSHVSALAAQRWLTADQLAGVTQASPFYNERDLTGMFYAQSWALVHMLNLAPSYRDRMPQFILLLSQARDPQTAFEQAFGVPMDKALADLERYVRDVRAVSVAAPPEASISADRVEPVSALESSLARADLALHVGHLELARSLFDAAARTNPRSPQAAAGLGALAMAENRKGDARRHLEHAITLGSQDAGTYFEFAMLERDTHGPDTRVGELLEKTVAVNPNFAEAHFLLGVRATDQGEYDAAIEHLREAVRILPKQSYFWHALGYTQAKLGRVQEALASARRAVATSSTSEQEAMGNALLQELRGKIDAATTAPVIDHASGGEAIGPARAQVTTPSGWQDVQGDARVEGELSNVECLGSSARLRISTADGSTTTLEVLNPRQVKLVDAPAASYEFSCGPQSLPVKVEYQSANGQVTRIEFQH
jgi:Flp pilus assembly protein TadD